MKRKINILFIIDGYCGYGGTERHLTYLAGMLDKEKYNCIVVPFTFNEDNLLSSSLSVKVIPVEVPRYYTFNLVFKAFDIIKIIKDNEIDIVQTFHFLSDTYGVLVSRFASIDKIISSRRDMGFKKGKWHLAINRFMNRYITKFITVSDAVGEWISVNENVSRNRQVTIRNGIDLSMFELPGREDCGQIRKEMGIRESDFVVGIVGHMRPEKGHAMFFDAACQLAIRIPNIKFVVVGLGELYETYRSFVKGNGLDDRTVFTGYVKDARKYIYSFDVACLTSKTEGFSNAILEYMALEKPVVATAVGGNREVIVDGYNGYLVPPDSPIDLADRIWSLFVDAELRREMGRNCRKTVEDKFSIETMIEAHSSLYEEILSRRAPSTTSPSKNIVSETAKEKAASGV